MNYQNQYKSQNQYKHDQNQNDHRPNKEYQTPSNPNSTNNSHTSRIIRSVMIADSNVYLRKGPGKQNDPICTIPKGSKVHRLDAREYGPRQGGMDSKEKWIRAEYGPSRLTGFICKEFLVPDEASEILEESKVDAKG